MSNRQLLALSLVGVFVAGLVFAALPISSADGTALFGYPYETSQSGGSGAKYDAYGSRFNLSSDVTVMSISCLMSGGYNPTGQGDHYIYRFAIYSDDNGTVGALINQTQVEPFIGSADIAGYSQGVWETASFPEAVHLSSGSYWLMAVHNASNYIGIHTDVPAKGYTTVTSVIGGMDFPASLSSPLYSVDYVLCLYASGEGTSSVSSPVSNYTHQIMTHLAVGCTTDASSATNKIEITGNLTANSAGVTSAPILLSYADNINATWHEISTAYTASDGSFSVTWYPTVTGSFVINATYPGNSTHVPTGAMVNVIVSSAVGNSQTVFSVDSNSTVSNLGFNSATGQLSFSVSGETGTTGYAEVYVGKSLVDDASKIKASIDGAAANFTVSSVGDAWVLYFSYHHSSHNIVFSLNNENSPTPNGTTTSTSPSIPELTLPLVIIALAALIAGVLAIKHIKSQSAMSKKR